MRELLEARGGVWPRGFEVVAAGLVLSTAQTTGRGSRPAAERIRLFLTSQGGVYEGTHATLADAAYMARETVTRCLPTMPDVSRTFLGHRQGYRYTLSAS